MKNNLVHFIKAWNFPDGNYGEKEIWINTDFEIKFIEGCRVNKNGSQTECTKLVYAGEVIKVIGTPQEFFKKCKENNTAIALLNDLHESGLTIKQFLQQHERLNGIAN